jgi:Protein of unknown function (DUF1207)
VSPFASPLAFHFSLFSFHFQSRQRPAILALAVIASLTGVSATWAQPAGQGTLQEPTWTLGSGTSMVLFPTGDVFPVYVADPHRPTNVVQELFIVGGGIPFTEGPLTRLAAGGRFGVLRIAPKAPGGRQWQVSIEAGLDALFDSQHRLDAAGWDGNYGLTVTTASGSRLGLKFALLHISAHLGDEYQDRTGVERINYTREEVALGASWRWSPRWRAYGETGIAYKMGGPSLERWRVQAGVEYDTGPGPCGVRFACYAALDANSMQERDWRGDLTAEFGIVARRGDRATRLFFEWRDGRPTVNEFFRESVSTIGLGVKVDL